MASEKNRRHKMNRKKKEFAFENTKASFVAGIAVIIAAIEDVTERFVPISPCIKLVEVLICLVLFCLTLGTDKMDKWLNKNILGVEKFGDILTVFSVVLFMVERILLCALVDIGMQFSEGIDKGFGIAVSLFFIVVITVGIMVGIYLLFCNSNNNTGG